MGKILQLSLDKVPTKSWCRINNFLKPKSQKTYPTLTLDNKTTKANADKAELLSSLWRGNLASSVTISMTQILGKSTSL